MYITDDFYNYRILKIIGIIALAIITCYHMLSNVWANRVNQALAIVKMLTLIVIIVIGFVQLGGTKNWKNAFEIKHGLSFQNISSALALVCLFYFYFYSYFFFYI